ncbi:MAG: carboxypeptidase-like regulatory domain-containing protein [Bacteroidota bacterium]
MLKINKIFTVILLSLCIFSPGCNKSGTDISYGQIRGLVRLADDLNNPQSYAGMQVTAENTGISTMSDSLGRYFLNGLQNGRYNLVYSKPGYGTYILVGFNNNGNVSDNPSLVPLVTLGQFSTTTFTALTVNIKNDSVILRPSIYPEGTTVQPRGIRFFYATTPDISSENFTAYSSVYQLSGTTGALKVGDDYFYALGFTSGETIYIKGYGDAFFSNDYDDPNTGKHIFPNLNQTSVAPVSFILP